MKPFSPSILKDAADESRGCLRKAIAKRLGGYREEKGDAAANGDRFHGYAEQFLLDGAMPPQTDPMGRLFDRGRALLPEPGEVPLVESYFQFDWDGLTFHGYLDYGDVGLRGDHKTSSNPRLYGLTADELPYDAQGAVYGFTAYLGTDVVRWYEKPAQVYENGDRRVLLDENNIPIDARRLKEFEEEPQIATLQWHYYPTRSGKPYTVAAVADPRAFLERWLPVAKELADIEIMLHKLDLDPKSPRTLNVLPNEPDACDGAGTWCPFFEHCEIFPIVERNEMAINLKKLQEKRAATRAALKAARNGGAAETPAPADTDGDDEVQPPKEVAAAPEESLAPPEAAEVLAEETAIDIAKKPRRNRKSGETEEAFQARLQAWNEAKADGVAVPAAPEGLGPLLSDIRKLQAAIDAKGLKGYKLVLHVNP